MSTFGRLKTCRASGRRQRVLRHVHILLPGISVLAVVAGSAFTIATTASVVALTPGTSSAAPTWVASTAATAGLSPEPVTTFNGGIHLTSVACASTTSCVAVGYYDYGYGGNGTQGLIETGSLSGGSWQWKAITAPEGGLTPGLLTAGDPQGDVMLRAVSCGTSTSCTAVGQYSDGTQLANGFNAIIETGTSTGGSWSWVSSSLSPGSLHPTLYTADGTNLGAVYLSAVSCSSSTCVATGYYTYVPSGAPAQVPEPLFWVDASGGWKQETTSTSGLNPAFGSPPKTISDSLRAVSCPTTTSCVAVGGYDDAAGTEYGVVVRGNPVSGTWTDSNAVTPTSPATVAGFLFTGVACASSTSCVVAGSGGQSEAGDIAETGTLKNSTWAWSDVSLPSSMDFVNGAAVSCPSGTYCVIAGGGLNDTAGQYHVQFESGAYADGKWSWTVANAPTNGLNPAISHSYSLLLTGVSCKLTTCVGVGSYTYGSNSYSGLFETLTISAGSTEGIVVNTTSDEKIDEAALSPASGAPFCAIDARADDRQCSLRAAIELANKLGGDQSITFDIPGQGVPKIAPASSLPTVTGSVTIDATTQAGGWVELSGANAGGGNGLQLEGGNSTVRGLVINAFDKGAGVLIDKGTGDVIAGDRIGTNAAGTAAAGNLDGIDVNASDAVLGGISGTSGSSCTGDCDLISGNHYGIKIEKQQGATVEGDYIGTDVSGEAAIGNYAGIDNEVFQNDGYAQFGLDLNGLECPGAAHGTVTIGGPTSEPGLAPGNVISGNSAFGVRIFCAATVQVAGNLIGLDAGGTRTLQTNEKTKVPEGSPINTTSFLINPITGGYVLRNLVGVDLFLDTIAMIGGPTKASENVIGGFEFGVRGLETSLDEPTTYTVGHDYIGTDITGTLAVPNDTGVLSAQPYHEYLEGPLGISVTDSLISGNLNVGVIGGRSLTGSRVGTNADGTAALPNMIGDSATLQVGGLRPVGSTTCDGPCNLISGNLKDAVRNPGTVQGNFIGTNITGTAALPNGNGFSAANLPPHTALGSGSRATSEGEVIGGASNVVARATCDLACNLIAGNDVAGIQAYNLDIVEGNLIGMGMTGLPLPNLGAGVVTTTYDTDLKPASIGGIGDLGNRIDDNAGAGVEVMEGVSPLVEGNSIAGNLGGIKIDTGAKAPETPQRVKVVRGPTSYTVSGDVPSTFQGGSYRPTIDVYGGGSCEDSGAVPLIEFTARSLSGEFSHELQGLSSNVRFITLTQSVDGSTSPYTPCVSVK